MKKLILSFVFCALVFQTFAQVLYRDLVYAPFYVSKNSYVYGINTYGFNNLNFYAVNTPFYKPLVIMVPGSGFINNGADPKLALEAEAIKFAQRGYSVAVVDYTRVPEASLCSFPFNALVAQGTADVHAAIRYLMVNAGTLKIDLNNMFMHGQSAGGLIANTAVWCSAAKFAAFFPPISKDMSLKAGVSGGDYTIKGLSMEATGVPFPQIFTQADRNANVSMVMFHSNLDNTVPFTCGTSSLCNISTIGGTGYIRNYIDMTPRNNYYVMFEYNCTRHDIGNTIGAANMYQVIANFYYNLLTNAPQVGSPGPLNPPVACAPNGFVPAGCNYNLRAGDFSEENDLVENTSSIFMKQKELVVSFSDDLKSAVSVYDVTGNLKRNSTVEAGQTINMEELSSGIYMIVVEHGGQTHRKKVLVD